MTSALDKLVIATMRQAAVGRVWLSVLRQDVVWTPRDAFVAWGNAPSGTAIEDVPGVVPISSMDLAYRRNVEAFLWRKTKGLAFSQTSCELEMELAGMSECAMDSAVSQDQLWTDRATDDNLRRAWFEGLPLIRALRAPEAPATIAKKKKKHKGRKHKHSGTED